MTATFDGREYGPYNFPPCPSGTPAASCVTFEGTIDAAGRITIPASGARFPAIRDTTDLKLQLTAPNGVIGELDADGTLTWDVRLHVTISDDPGQLGDLCRIEQLELPLTTGMSGFLQGQAFDFDAGTATLVNNDYVIPGLTDCGAELAFFTGFHSGASTR